MRPRHCCNPNCGCKKTIVHPVKEDVVNCCTEETVQHVHPVHTTLKNHHLVKNEHVYPHSTSVENYCDCVDINKGGNCVPYGKNLCCGKGKFPGVRPGMKPYPPRPARPPYPKW